MPYSFLNAGLGINGKSPTVEYREFFQESLNRQFDNASNVYTVGEETYNGSGVFENISVRITSLVSPTTGDIVEQDFKKILFKDVNHSVEMGRLYYFGDNYWMVINVDDINTLANTVTVRRMNNTLRWIDEITGALYNVPCSVSYLINENRDYATAGSAVVVPSGMITLLVQFNEKTNTIQPNQRFLFGNQGHWTAMRVEGGGLNNFDNQKTSDNSSVGFIRFSMGVDYENIETDDLVNGIANVNTNVYVITLDKSSISGGSGQTVLLDAIVTLNDAMVSRNLSWSSDDDTVATVDSSGLVTFVGEGSATITCSMENNSTVTDSCSVTVVGAPVDTYQAIIEPNVNRILEDSNQSYTVYLYKNGVVQADTFSIVLDAGSVPSSNYVFTAIDGNNFVVQNLEKFLTDKLTITATSGIYSTSIQISLVGAW